MLDHVDGADKTNQPAAYASKGRFHKGGANTGLRAYGIAKIVALPSQTAKAKKVEDLLSSCKSCTHASTEPIETPP